MKFVAVILAVTLGTALGAIPWEPEPRGDEWWMGRHDSFVQNSVNNPGAMNVLFYGDSITEGWGGEGKPTFDQYYAPLGTANYGIGGDRTEHVLWRIRNGEVTSSLNPKVCVLKIGTNNIGANTEADIARGVETIVRDLRQRLPNMKILLLGILPRFNEEQTNITIRINNMIKPLDDGRNIRFLDMKDHFYYGGGNLATELFTPDLLHLSAAGYRKWAEVMDPLFRQMLVYM